MSKVDKFKAAFLTKGNLNKKIGACATGIQNKLKAAREDLKRVLEAGANKQQGDALDALEARMATEVADGPKHPGKAWCALKDLTTEVEQAAKLVKDEAGRQDVRAKRFQERLDQIHATIAEARVGRREIVNTAAAKRLGDTLENLNPRVDAVARNIKSNSDCQKGYNDLDPLLKEAEKLKHDIDAAKTTPAEQGSPRLASRTAVTALAGSVPAIQKRLNSKDANPQGRTPLQEVQARLEVYDEHFARDPKKDPDAELKNTAMRIAAVVSTTSREITRDQKINDPNLQPRVARSLIAEFEKDMAKALAAGAGGDDKAAAVKARQEAEKALRVAEAMVMDDPVTKLMTGKVSAPDAVQRIRDMAQAGGIKPSEMLEMLRQQFEMQIGSLSNEEVRKGAKKTDAGQGFVLEDLYGELSPDQLGSIVELSTVRSKMGVANVDADRPKWRADGGLNLSASGPHPHRVATGDTLASLAATYVNDAKKTAEIVALNKTVLVPLAEPKGDQRHGEVRISDLKASDQLPVGAVMMVPSKASPLDQLAPYVAAFDTIELEAMPSPRGVGEAPPKEPVKPPKGLVRPTADQLKAGASKLTSPKEVNRNPADKRGYIPAPGLGQSHKLTGPLEDANAEDREARIAARQKRIDQLSILADKLDKLQIKKDSDAFKEAQAEYNKLIAEDDADRLEEQRTKRHAAINERQYAHLRLLLRADEDDKEEFLRAKGKSVEETVLEKMSARYNVDAAGARGLLASAIDWIGKVPLTITFKAENLFSDPTKDEPTHGTAYASEVTYSRGREKMGDLIGRADNIKDQVGVTGGKKTGWEKDRGENYMRWRTEKDDREGRRDYLAHEDQQIFGAANPNFEKLKGGGTGGASKDLYGSNYYGDAHFLLKDEVRPRLAFAVRGGGISIGGGKSANQRKDLLMIVHDMLNAPEGMGASPNAKYLDALLLAAKKKDAVAATGLDWEVHLYGGFDITKDAQAMYIKPALDKVVLARIQRFTAKYGIECKDYGAKPNTLVVQTNADPKKFQLDK
jgi:hypothetical protein